MASCTSGRRIRASTGMDHISKLPIEVLCDIIMILTSLDDLNAFLSTSKCVHDTCINLPMQLPVVKSTDFQNNKHYLTGQGFHVFLEVAAPGLALWALKSKSNKRRLTLAITEGKKGLLSLASNVVMLRLKELYKYSAERRDIVDGLIAKQKDECDKCEVPKHYKNHCRDLKGAISNYLTYCALFSLDIHCGYGEETSSNVLGPAMRRQWVRDFVRDVPDQTVYRRERQNKEQRGLQNLFQCTTIKFHATQWVVQLVPDYHQGKLVTLRPSLERFNNFTEHMGLRSLELYLHGKNCSRKLDEYIQEEFEYFYDHAQDDMEELKESDVYGADDTERGWQSLLSDLHAVGLV